MVLKFYLENLFDCKFDLVVKKALKIDLYQDAIMRNLEIIGEACKAFIKWNNKEIT